MISRWRSISTCGRLLLGEVERADDDAGRVVIFERPGGERHRDLAAVNPAEAGVVVIEGVPGCPHGPSHRTRRDRGGSRTTLHRIGSLVGKAEQRDRRRIGIADRAVAGIEHQHRDRICHGNGAEAPARFEQRCLLALARGARLLAARKHRIRAAGGGPLSRPRGRRSGRCRYRISGADEDGAEDEQAAKFLDGGDGTGRLVELELDREVAKKRLDRHEPGANPRRAC